MFRVGNNKKWIDQQNFAGDRSAGPLLLEGLFRPKKSEKNPDSVYSAIIILK